MRLITVDGKLQICQQVGCMPFGRVGPREKRGNQRGGGGEASQEGPFIASEDPGQYQTLRRQGPIKLRDAGVQSVERLVALA